MKHTVHRSERNITAERNEQDHCDRERLTCLGAGCCAWCGRPLGEVAQVGGGTRNYHDGGHCLD